MIRVALSTLASLLEAELDGVSVDIETVVIDGRKAVAGCLFVAIQGERFDGHQFAEQAVTQGAAALLVSHRLPLAVPQLIVADTRLALGLLAAWVRQQSRARVVALTGSSGKTSVKEMTAAILAQCGDTLYTEGNKNNDIGVPLTLLRLTPQHQFAVIELGANHPGEIAYSTELVQPEAVLITNLAACHLEGFGSPAGVARAKGEIFSGLAKDGIAIINAESNDQANWLPQLAQQRVWRFAVQPGVDIDFYASDIQTAAKGSRFTLHTPKGAVTVQLPLPGRHNIANALGATALALAAGAPLKAICLGLAKLRSVPGRLFPIQLAEEQLLLDDSYNANVGSMKAAIATLAEMPGYRVLVVGDMKELGETSADCHRQVGEAAAASSIDRVFSVGDESRYISQSSGKGQHFVDKNMLIEELAMLCSQQSSLTLLVKGSRSSAMEQVVQGLQERLQESTPC